VVGCVVAERGYLHPPPHPFTHKLSGQGKNALNYGQIVKIDIKQALYSDNNNNIYKSSNSFTT
jgi:hypothetical protein